ARGSIYGNSYAGGAAADNHEIPGILPGKDTSQHFRTVHGTALKSPTFFSVEDGEVVATVVALLSHHPRTPAGFHPSRFRSDQERVTADREGQFSSRAFPIPGPLQSTVPSGTQGGRLSRSHSRLKTPFDSPLGGNLLRIFPEA